MKKIPSETSLPLISVVVCTYNGAKYVKKQIQSLLNQTYKNIEILIGDDRSTDNTLEIIKKFADQHSNIRYYRNTKNIGFNANFEKAIRSTSGEYIAICDQDDIWSPIKLSRLIDNISDNWLIFSNSAFINDKDTIIGGTLLSSFSINNRSYKGILLMNFVTGHTTLFKRTLLDYCLPFPSIKFYDWWLGFVALYHNKITYLDSILTYYRVHSESVIQKQLLESFKNKELERAIEFDNTCNQLRFFQKYRFLKEEDRKFIKALRKAYITKQKKLSLSLFRIVFFNEKQLLTGHHFKKNRMIRAFNYSRKINLS